MEEAILTPLDLVAHFLQRGTKTCAWLTGTPSTVNGIDLGAPEWLDTLFLHYGIDPLDLHTRCDGCGAAFSVSISIYHTLDCKEGGLIDILWAV